MTDLNVIPIKAQKENLVNITKDGRPVTTSMLIADRFGKEHRNVIQAIENLECSNEFGLLNFQQSFYINQQNKKQPMFIVTRDGFFMLGMGFTGKEAMKWKEEFIAAFNAMEKKLYDRSTTRLSQDDSDAISYLLSSVDTIQSNMAKLTELRKYEDNPVAPFCDDQCLYKAGGFILKDEIYSRYKYWCCDKEEYALTKPVFFKKLYKYAAFSKAVKRMINGNASYGITGFRLKEASYER